MFSVPHLMFSSFAGSAGFAVLEFKTWNFLPKCPLIFPQIHRKQSEVGRVTSGLRVPEVRMGQSDLPALAFGVGSAWLGDKEQQQKLKRTVLQALDAGFRHLDLAEAYDNSHVVGEAVQEWLQKTGCRREDRLGGFVFYVLGCPGFGESFRDFRA